MKVRTSVASREGFTLIEVMIAAVIGTILLLAIYQVLLLNQRSFSIQSEQIRQRQTLRAALDVMTSHLSHLSGAGGDIIAGGQDSITFRSLKAFGVVCAGTPQGLRVEQHGVRVAPSDSMMVLAENGIADPLDDTWLVSVAINTDTTTLCPTGSPAYDVEVGGIGVGSAVRIGAPLRAFEQRTFRLGPLLGQWFLTRSGPAGPEALVGPLAPPNSAGLHFEYLDSLGIAVADPRTADQIIVTVRTNSRVLGTDRSPLVDSAQARISLKN